MIKEIINHFSLLFNKMRMNSITIIIITITFILDDIISMLDFFLLLNNK